MTSPRLSWIFPFKREIGRTVVIIRQSQLFCGRRVKMPRCSKRRSPAFSRRPRNSRIFPLTRPHFLQRFRNMWFASKTVLALTLSPLSLIFGQGKHRPTRLNGCDVAVVNCGRIWTRFASPLIHPAKPNNSSDRRLTSSPSGAPNLFDVIDHRDRINWPTETTRLTSMPLGAGDSQLIITTVPDTLAVLAWLHRDALIARLEGEIDRCSQDDKALSAEQRAKKSAEILSDILAAEREEETLIERMEAGGALFLRRTDADPRAVLGLSSDMPAPDVAR